MPLSFIQSADFEEQQLIGTSIYRDDLATSIQNTAENLATFEYFSISKENAAIDGIKIDIMLQGQANTQQNIRYNGIFTADKDAAQNYLFSATVNGRIPNSQQLNAIKNNISISEITDTTRSQNKITLLIDRLSIVNARYEGGRRMSILNFALKIPISESSIEAPMLSRNIDALRFQINEANLYGVIPTARVYNDSDAGKTLSISFLVREVGLPLSFTKRSNINYPINLIYTLDISNVSASFSISRSINLQNYGITMTVNTAPLTSFLSDALVVYDYSTTQPNNIAYSPYEIVYFGIGTSEPRLVFSASFNDITRRYISQYASCGFSLYRHNSFTGSAFSDTTDTIRCAYSLQLGLSNSPDNNTSNNPAEIFALRILDVDYATLTIDNQKVSVTYKYANGGVIPNVLSLRFQQNREANASIRFRRDTSNPRLLIVSGFYTRYPEGFGGLIDIRLECNEFTTLEHLKVLIERRTGTIQFNVTPDYLFLSPLQVFTDNTYSIETRILYGILTYSGNARNISANYFDGIFNTRPTNDIVNLQYFWTDNPTLGQVVDAIRNLNIRRSVAQSVPIFNFWIANKYHQIPDSIANKWRDLSFKKLFYKTQTRTFDLSSSASITAVANCFVDIQESSSVDRIEAVNDTSTILPLSTSRNISTTLTSLAQNLTTQINRYITDYENIFINVSRIEFTIPNDVKNLSTINLYISDVTGRENVSTSTFSGLIAIPLQSAYDDEREYIIDNRGTVITDVYTIPVDLSSTISEFVQTLQNNSIINASIETRLFQSSLANLLMENVTDFAIFNLTANVSPSITYTRLRTNYFILSNFATFRLLASQISLAMTSYISCDVATQEADSNTLAIPSTLDLITVDLSDNSTLTSSFTERQTTENITYEFDLNFTLADRDPAGDENDTNVIVDDLQGIQVALGGYRKNNTFFAYDAPNAFFEPSVNTLFPIEFVTEQAEIAYILVRTRRTIDGGASIYTAVPNCYLGSVAFDSGLLQIDLNGTVPTNFEFTSVWTEDFGMPIVYAVPLKSYKNTLSITDRCNLESIKLVVTNVPAGFESVGFLAINKNNLTNTQKESKAAVTFGLVLDAIGAWDVLISPNSILRENNDGSISYDDRFYNRALLGSDEAYRMSFYNLPSNFATMLSLSPIPNNSQIWVLRVSPQIKQYLASISDANNPNSLNGCFFTVDIKIDGVYSQVSSVVRVKIYRDYTCVYDVGLCDSYWNLVDPPKLSTEARQSVENRINLRVQELVDCEETYEQDTANLSLRQNLLITAEGVPTFPNGNALLLIKTSFESTLQNVSLLSATDIRRLRYKDCTVVARNRILENLMNREFLYLPNNDVPITDTAAIQSAIATQNSFLYMRPQFQFPPDDQYKDCGDNEIVIVGLGYTFKNWRNTFRSDSLVLGFQYTFSLGIYSTPQLNLCTRYYYAIAKT